MNVINLLIDLLTLVFLFGGLFFMTVAAVGLVKMPDIYNRMHAATKGVTLGISGIVIAMALVVSRQADVTATAVVTKVVLVIMFQFIANPVGAHLLSRAAHLDGAKMWEGNLSDELAEDRQKQS